MKVHFFRLIQDHWKLAATLVLCVMFIAGFGAWLKYRLPERLPKPQAKSGRARPLLATVSAPTSVRNSLLSSDFVLVNRFRDLSRGCRASFFSSFSVTDSSKMSNADVADPTALFQTSDALVAGLPFRRLIFAGEKHDRCFIYYQHGGTMYPRWCLAVIDKSHHKPLWVGMRIGSLPAGTIDELKAQVIDGAFRDDAGWVC